MCPCRVACPRVDQRRVVAQSAAAAAGLATACARGGLRRCRPLSACALSVRSAIAIRARGGRCQGVRVVTACSSQTDSCIMIMSHHDIMIMIIMIFDHDHDVSELSASYSASTIASCSCAAVALTRELELCRDRRRGADSEFLKASNDLELAQLGRARAPARGALTSEPRTARVRVANVRGRRRHRRTLGHDHGAGQANMSTIATTRRHDHVRASRTGT